MKKLLLILVVLAVVASGGWYVWNQHSPAQTGAIISLSQASTTPTEVTISNSNGQDVKKISIEPRETMATVKLGPGVYSFAAKSTNTAVPPLPAATVTVTEGKLSQLTWNISTGE